MDDVEDPEAGALDFEELTALLSRRAQMARDHYAALRNALLRGHGAILSDRERSLISNVLHVLVADMGELFRRGLAARQAEHDDAAETVAATLDARWAGSMQTKLAKVGALGDIDLIAAVEHRVLEHLLDVAHASQSEKGLALDAGSDAPDPLGMEGVTADIRLAKAVSDYLVEKSRRFDGYRNPRLPLHEIPSALSDRLIWTCVATWRDEMLSDWRFDEADLDDTLENIAARAIDTVALDARRMEKAVEVADALTDAGRLSATLLPVLLRQGEIGVFEAVLSRLLGLPLSHVRALTFEPGGARLAVALHGAGMTREDFSAVHGIIRDLRPIEPQDGPSAPEIFARCTPDVVGRIVRHWRRRPAYLAALHKGPSDGPADP